VVLVTQPLPRICLATSEAFPCAVVICCDANLRHLQSHSRAVLQIQHVGLIPADTLYRRLLMLIAPALNQIVFTVANWLGSSRLPKIFRSRGYLLGTSQVTCPMPGEEPATLADAVSSASTSQVSTSARA